MNAFEDLKSIVYLNCLGNRRQVVELLEQGVLPSEVLKRGQAAFLREGEAKSSLSPFLQGFDPEKEIEECGRRGIRLVTLFDQDYPPLLRNIYDPPLVLYIKGSLAETDRSAVAIVGTRHPSFYGTAQAKKFGRGLAEKGLTVVSGFAKGIDQAAHEGALEVSYGRTIAVLGCGLDVEYPRGSASLAERIAGHGALLSEYPLGTPPRAENFPRRNRIISGLSLGVLVVEAAPKSGSLITAREAAEQGREVFALPGPVDQLTSKGTHSLLKEGAYLAEVPEDIVEVLGFSIVSNLRQRSLSLSSPNAVVGDLRQRTDPPSADSDGFPPKTCGNDSSTLEGDNDEESRILGLLRRHPMTCEELQEQASLPPSRIAAALTLLEMRKKVRKTLQGSFCGAAEGR